MVLAALIYSGSDEDEGKMYKPCADSAAGSTGGHFRRGMLVFTAARSTSSSMISLLAQRYTGPFGWLAALKLHECMPYSFKCVFYAHLQGPVDHLSGHFATFDLRGEPHVLAHNCGLVGNI